MISSGFTVILESDLLVIDFALRYRGVFLSFPHCVLACDISSIYILGVILISSMTLLKKKRKKRKRKKKFSTLAFMAVNKIMEFTEGVNTLVGSQMCVQL